MCVEPIKLPLLFNPLSPIDVYRRHLDPMHLQGFSPVQKETKKSSEGLGTTLRHELKKFGQISARLPH